MSPAWRNGDQRARSTGQGRGPRPVPGHWRAATRVAALAPWMALLTPSAAWAQAKAAAEPVPALASCAAIGAAADRLRCYDALAGRALAPDVPPAEQPAPGQAAGPANPLGSHSNSADNSAGSSASSSALMPVGSLPQPPAATGAGGVARASSLMSRYWELEAADKRGTFNFVGYKPNFVLPLHLTSRINRAPQSPTQANVPQPDYRREEAKFQLSLRTKLFENLGLPGADLWAGFTQVAMWQLYNGVDSKPFRNTDYQPELMYIVPVASGMRALPADWQWRYWELGLAHQSNGQSDPLSRSWNRVYLGAGLERGPWRLHARFNQRLAEPLATDNNPDLVAFRGHGEFQLGWAAGLHTATALYRTTLRNTHFGALELAWTYPVARSQPNGLRWIVQAFRGYGETLTDYNFRQTSIGLGVTFLQF